MFTLVFTTVLAAAFTGAYGLYREALQKEISSK